MGPEQIYINDEQIFTETKQKYMRLNKSIFLASKVFVRYNTNSYLVFKKYF
jgi:hypothetical protein